MSDIQKYENNSPAKMMEMALDKGADLTQLEKLLELQERFDKNEARKAFHKAMADFKLNCPEVEKDKYNNQYKSWYVSLGKLVSTISPVMSKYGLSHDWEQYIENNIITVRFTVTHELGHSKSNTFSSPPDGSGSKNPIQQLKSSVTYLKSITFESGMGLASTDANIDDDGTSTSPDEKKAKDSLDRTIIDKTALEFLRKRMAEKHTSEETVIKYFNDNDKSRVIKSLSELTRTQYSLSLELLK